MLGWLRPFKANPFLANPMSVLVVSQSVRPRRVGGPKFRVFFSLPPHRSFCLSGCLLVESWWCLKRRVAQMFSFGVLWLSCEAPAAPKPPSEIFGGAEEGGPEGREGGRRRVGRTNNTHTHTKHNTHTTHTT